MLEVGKKFIIHSHGKKVPFVVTEIHDEYFYGNIIHEKYQISRVKMTIPDIGKVLFESEEEFIL